MLWRKSGSVIEKFEGPTLYWEEKWKDSQLPKGAIEIPEEQANFTIETWFDMMEDNRLERDD